MGHDLDDDELKATKNKFYKLNKDDFDKNQVFILGNKNDYINVIIENLNDMRLSIDDQTYFEINYNHTKELYFAMRKLLNEFDNAKYENQELKNEINEIRDKAEVMDYYSLNDVIDDLSKLIGDYEENEQ